MNKPSQYARYLIESNHSRKIYESEKGFFTYFINGDELYIEDIFVEPDHRGNGVASKEFLDIGIEIAKTHNCVRIVGSVVPTNPMATISLFGQLKMGFKLARAENNFIVLIKEI